MRPNTGWLPAELLDDDGFVRVEPDLRVAGHPGVFAIGDVAATDPLRYSARNRADRLLARNIRASSAAGRCTATGRPARRWGSVLGIQPNGLEVFAPDRPGGSASRPGRSRSSCSAWIVRRGIYRGIRKSG